MNVGCNERDRETLEVFKGSIKDPWNLLYSWSAEQDCCNWFGVHCDNLTRRVTELDLSRNFPSDNRLGGQINLYVLKLESLSFLDLHGNDFNAIYIPTVHNLSLISTIHHGANFSNLVYLDFSQNDDLRINDLIWVSQLSSLKYLDLSNADLSEETLWLQRVNLLPSLRELRLRACLGSLPKCLGNIGETLDDFIHDSHYHETQRTVQDSSRTCEEYQHLFYRDCDKYGYSDFMNFRVLPMQAVDLSMNDLSGSIPPELFMSGHLAALNLSRNGLTGSIPNEIWHMKELELLDLSRNQLVGEIPQSMFNINSLSVLNLSYNNLSGKIPLGTQFLTFEASSYMGNPELYGGPLTEDNPEGEIPNEEKEIIEGSDDDFSKCFKMGMAIGFAYSFWGVCLSLFFIYPWRNAYFRFLRNMYDRIYVFIALKKKWLRRHVTGYDICFQPSRTLDIFLA
ncbi:receptor-like protein EIX2 [Neltuma alba]|uniref:receptor-like protein EIX2 n=1 Tax=Neltuma alba TaxID=207710 RepID=UPI0010A2EF55|nr:receptor-like protein EIX2 [Prosopis alba]